MCMEECESYRTLKIVFSFLIAILGINPTVYFSSESDLVIKSDSVSETSMVTVTALLHCFIFYLRLTFDNFNYLWI